MPTIFENAAKARWGKVLGAFVAAATEAAGPVRTVLDELTIWGTELAKNAAVKWSPRLIYPEKCQCPSLRRGKPEQCPNTALVECNACGRMVCLVHVRLDFGAEGICAACTLEIMAQKKGKDWAWPEMPKKDPDSVHGRAVAEAFEVLDLEEDASFAEVKAAYKKLAFEHSPDKVKEGAGRRLREERMKRINEAYSILKKHYEEAA